MLEEVKKDDVQLLTDIGFLTLSYGKLDSAKKIFEGVKAARPDNEAGPLGMALVDLARGDIDTAIGTLRSLPPSDSAQLYLALALLKSGEKQEAEDLLTDLSRTANGTPIGEIASNYIADLSASAP